MFNDEEHHCTYALRTPYARARNNSKEMGGGNAYDYKAHRKESGGGRSRVELAVGSNVGFAVGSAVLSRKSSQRPGARRRLQRTDFFANWKQNKKKCTSERTKDFVGFPTPSSLHVTFNKFKFKFKTPYSIRNNGPSPIGCICNQSIMHKYNAFVHASITFLFIFLVISSRTVGFYRYMILGNIKLCIFISLK